MWLRRQRFDFSKVYLASKKSCCSAESTCNAAPQHLYPFADAETAGSSANHRRDKDMTKTPDMTAMFKDVMGSFPVDTAAFEGAFKNSASLNEKLSGVALTAVEKSAEISSKWTKDTLGKLEDMSKAKAEPADYAKAMTDFASASAETAAEHMAAFAEIAKKVQMDTVELMMAAGKDLQEETTAAVKKATTDVQAAAKKATAK
jgi:hypothetical protein